MSAPPLPTSVEQLAPWRVWADALLEDRSTQRLGQYLALELSLGARPSPDTLVRFRKAALRACRVSRAFEAGWMLGQVRHLRAAPKPARPMMHREEPAMDSAHLPELRDTLATESLAQLESLTVFMRRDGFRRRWREVMQRLASTCRTLALGVSDLARSDVEPFFDALPAHVDTVRPLPRWRGGPSAWIDDRLAWVDLRSFALVPSLADAIAARLEQTSRVRVRLGTVATAELVARLGDRAVIGGDGDARLVNEAHGGTVLLERSPLIELQRRFGVISVHAQLARQVPEPFDVSRQGLTLTARAWAGDTLTRHGDGSWWLRQRNAQAPQWDAPSFAVEDAPPDEPLAQVRDGGRVLIAGGAWRFSSRES